MSLLVGDKTPHSSEISFDKRRREIDCEEKKEKKAQQKCAETDKKNSYTDFYQVNRKNAPILRQCLQDNPKALNILLFIFEHMDKYNAVVCSYAVFMEVFDISKPTVTRCIKYLKDNGLIYTQKSGTSNVYIANPDLVWNSWGNNKKYCQFPANIVLARSEQENIQEIRNKTITVKEEQS